MGERSTLGQILPKTAANELPITGGMYTEAEGLLVGMEVLDGMEWALPP